MFYCYTAVLVLAEQCGLEIDSWFLCLSVRCSGAFCIYEIKSL